MALAQHAVNVLLIGGIYACVGIGFSLVYGVMNIVNMAHGAFVMFGGYVTFWLFEFLGLDPLLSLPVTMTLFFMIGYSMQKYVINRVLASDAFMAMILTFGFEIILLNAALLIWKSTFRTITTSYARLIMPLGGVSVPYLRIGIFLLAILLTILMWVLINKTRIGSAIRATALNKEAAKLVGVEVPHIYAVTYGIAAALAAASGTMMATVYPISPGREASYLATAFVVVVLGGLGSMSGAVVGGLALAALQTAGVIILGPSYQSMVAFGVFVLVLLFRPYGLVGKRFYSEPSQ